VGTVKSGGLRYGAEMACIMRAAQFLYLNRHGYNGLCRYSRKTGFNVPFGKYKSVYFPENEIRLFAEKANDTKAIFLCAPFQRSLQVVTGGDVLVYCDPPYLPESKTADFTQYHTEPFTEDNHRQLARQSCWKLTVSMA
jgi:DNA adenine methylase